MAEEHAATLQRQRVIEDKKMRELEKIREQLEIHLEEEKSAKKDEEIVRQLQARVLEEEWGRREQLEKLQEEQRIMLEQERKKREDFEKEQQEKERQLRGKTTKPVFRRISRIVHCNIWVFTFLNLTVHKV